MKKILLLSLGLCLNGLIAQNLITLMHQGQSAFYAERNIGAAYAAAQPGDTILCPGGEFIFDLTIGKRIHFLGVGHRPDSTYATDMSTLVGNLSVINGGDSASFQGFYLTGNATIGDQSHFRLSRCFVEGEISLGSNSWNCWIEECISLLGASLNGRRHFIRHNIFSSNTNGGTGCIYANNVFLGTLSMNTNQVRNNIFYLGSGNIITGSNNVIQNNLFVADSSQVSGTNFILDNLFNQSNSSIFIHHPEPYFDYNHDYHLQPTCPGHTLATDRGQVGIYGGQIPFKNNTHPVQPRVVLKSIQGRSDSLGRLPVRLKVSSEDH